MSTATPNPPRRVVSFDNATTAQTVKTDHSIGGGGRGRPAESQSGSRNVPMMSAVWLVADREMGSKLRSKAFLISTVILLLVALGGVIWMGLQGASPSATKIATTGEVAAQLAETPDLEMTEVADRAAAEALVSAGEVEAAVIADPGASAGLVIIANESAPQQLLLALSVTPEVELLEPAGDSGPMRYVLGLVFGLVFMMAAISFGTPITTSVVEEKQTRVVEILISAIPARALLAGKVLGSTILAMGQILLLAAAAVIGLIVTGQTEFLQGIGGPIIWFAVFFLFGFILLAAMFAAAGALVSRQEDVGPTMTPVMYLTMIPYFLVIIFGQNEVVMTILSFIPFSAPVAMPVRLFFGEAMWWEPLAALAVMLVMCVVMIIIGGKIYENSLLKMGARVKFRDALRAA